MIHHITREMIDRILEFSKGKEYKSLAALDKFDLSYEDLSEQDERQEILKQLKRIKTDTQKVDAPERRRVWEDGWAENLSELKQTHSVEALAPKYFRPNCPSRLFRHFIKPKNQFFDFELEKIIKGCLLEEYLIDYDDVYEFGCGTCADLLDLGGLFPSKHLHARDLTASAVEIANILRDEFGSNIVDSSQFNFITPDEAQHLEENSAVYTFSALEQIGDRYGDFVEYLISENPGVVIHLEPINEFYDEDNLVDWIAKEFHENRHYLNGYFNYLSKLEKEKRIKIIFYRRTEVGGWNHESNSIIVWKPM